MKALFNSLLTRVSIAHGVSHLHIMTVPAMLPLLPKAMDVGFVELGVAIGVFNGVSAVVQAPLGFAVDRVGPRKMLMAALALGTLSFAALALYPTYLLLLLSMALAGLANGVYHPADYALLSRGVDPKRMGRAFSIHTSSGYLGGALAPLILIGAAVAWGVEWAFAISALGGAIALMCIAFGFQEPAVGAGAPAAGAKKQNANDASRPLVTPVATLALLTLLFMLLSLSTGSIDKFAVSALIEGYAVPLSVANVALTAYLCASACGVLAGGVLADKTSKHGMVAAGAFALAALLVVIIATISLPSLVLIITLGSVGFLAGVVAPSRDMLVRAASPAGAEGRTFGIVSTGFNIGGVIGPVLFGWLIDRGMASGVLWTTVLFMAITTVIVLIQEKRATARRLCAEARPA